MTLTRSHSSSRPSPLELSADEPSPKKFPPQQQPHANFQDTTPSTINNTTSIQAFLPHSDPSPEGHIFSNTNLENASSSGGPQHLATNVVDNPNNQEAQPQQHISGPPSEIGDIQGNDGDVNQEAAVEPSHSTNIPANDDTADVLVSTEHEFREANASPYNTRRRSAAAATNNNGVAPILVDHNQETFTTQSEEPSQKRPTLVLFEKLPPLIVVSILSYIEQTISIDYQHNMHATTLPQHKLWDPSKAHWMIFDLRKRKPAERRTQPWIATRQDILMYTMYGKFKSDETSTPRLLWTSLQFACPYPELSYREQFANATPGFSCSDYVPWGQVESLRLSGCFTPYSLKYLQYAHKLEYLSIEAESPEMPYYQVTNRAINLIPKNLQYLDLSFVNVDEAGVRMLFERLTNVKVVGLNGLRGGIRRVSTARLINQAPHLTQLEIRQNDIGDDIALELFKNSRLTFLNLSQNRITPRGWAGLKHNTSINTLHFFDSQINDEFLDIISVHPHVKDLHMEGCIGATDTGIRSLLTNVGSKIASISLARCAISSLALTGISLNDTLKSIYLDFNPNLSVETFHELSRVPQLKDVSAVGCQLSDAHVEALLHENFSLKNLFLSHNDQLGWETINALIGNLTVSYVILAECDGLTDEMINKLIGRSKSIHQLVLDSNKQLTDKAVESIESNATLASLSALGTKFSEEVYERIKSKCENILVYNSNQGDFYRSE